MNPSYHVLSYSHRTAFTDYYPRPNLLSRSILPRDAMQARHMLSSCVRASVRLPSVRLSACLSVTSRRSMKTIEPRITQTTPYDSTGTLHYLGQTSRLNSNGVTPTGAPNRGGLSYNWRLLTNISSRCISETVQDRDIVTMKPSTNPHHPIFYTLYPFSYLRNEWT